MSNNNKKSSKKMNNSMCGYQIVDKISKGSHGQVYKVKDEKNRLFAAKKYLDDWTRDDVNLLELEVFSAFRHDNIMKAEKFFTPYNCPNAKSLVIITEIADEDLSTFSDRNDNYFYILKYAFEIFQGLNFIHNNNVIHLDLKCQNVVLVKGKAKLIDFGASYKTDGILISKELMTTDGYRTPENLEKELSGKRDFHFSKDNDIWAGILILVYMIIGEKMYSPRSSLNFFKKLTLDTKEKSIRDIISEAENLVNFRKKDAKKLGSFLNMALQYKKENRPSIKEILSHEIFNNIKVSNNPGYVSNVILFEKGNREKIRNVIYSIIYILLTKEKYKVYYLFLAIELVYRLYPKFSYNTDYLVQAVSYIILNFNSSSCNIDDYKFLSEIINYLEGHMMVNFLFEKCKNLKELVFAWRKILYPIIEGNFKIYENYNYQYFEKDVEKFNFVAKSESKDINIKNFSNIVGMKLINKELKFS